MGKYNDIWLRIDEYEKTDKAEKRKKRAAKRMQIEEKRNEALLAQVEDLSLCDEVTEGEKEDVLPRWVTTDYKIIQNYECPPFAPDTPNLSQNGALKKYRDRFGKYLAFIDCVKYYRSSKYCSVLALGT